MLMYCLIAVVLSIPLLPMLYFKCIMNGVYIFFNNKREAYPGENSIQLLLTIVLNPPILILSLLVDLITLPNMLLANEKNFEFKYQQSLETLTDA